MSIFSRKPTPQLIKSGVYPKRLSYDEKRKRDAAYRTTRNANKPKLPAVQIAVLLSTALLLSGVIIKLTHALISSNGKSALFLIFFAVILIVIFYSVALFYVRRILNAYGVGGNLFTLLYLAGIISSCLLLQQFKLLTFSMTLALPTPTLLAIVGIHGFIVLIFAAMVLWYSGNRWHAS